MTTTNITIDGQQVPLGQEMQIQFDPNMQGQQGMQIQFDPSQAGHIQLDPNQPGSGQILLDFGGGMPQQGSQQSSQQTITMSSEYRQEYSQDGGPPQTVYQQEFSQQNFQGDIQPDMQQQQQTGPPPEGSCVDQGPAPAPSAAHKPLSPAEEQKMQELLSENRSLAITQQLTMTVNCMKCSGALQTGEIAVMAPKLGENCFWHPSCFSCTTCMEMLVDLVYCHMDNSIYCERHYAEMVKPRCAACDELIFSGEYTKAMDSDWHSGHFCCHNCDLNLTGHRYILRDEHPYCIKCYENLFANSCEECKTPIGTDSKDLSYKDKHWHEKCFKCSDCQNSLVDQPFASKNEKLYCADCHDNNFAARCDGCQNIFRAGMKKYEYKGKQWHEQCFCCKVCQQPIGNKSFIPRDQEVVCVPCYEEQYAQRCMKCNGVINKGGITYKGTPWHRECFTCNNCNKVLAGEKFTSREEKPYCAECFGDLFAKKCIRCTKPITGLGGTKFISFEERHWHSDCFVCYKCNVSLVGRGFLTDGSDILCPDCGRA